MTTPVEPAVWKLPPFSVNALMLSAGEVTDWGVTLLGVDKLWKETEGEGIRVAVLDTGCTLTHPDLRDAVVDAKDFTDSRFGPNDANGHGTHCAGIVAARRGNDFGCVGIAPKAGLLIGKVLGDNGSGSSQGIVSGIDWAVRSGADIISMSLGSPSPDEWIRQAIIDATKAGVFVIVAAGNSGPGPNTVEFPGAWPEAITVGAMNRAGKVSRFSSRGKPLCVVAPGEDIISCWHRAPLASLSGTSMATPAVAGVAALLLAKYRQAGDKSKLVLKTQDDLRTALRSTAIDMDAPGADPHAGWGLVNPEKLFRAAEPPPVASPTPMPSPVPAPFPIPTPGGETANDFVKQLVAWLITQQWFTDLLLSMLTRFASQPRFSVSARDVQLAALEFCEADPQ